MTLALVTVTGTLRAPDTLTPLRGTVTFTPAAGVLVDPADGRILAGAVTMQLDTLGSFSIPLVPTDAAGIQPAANTWNWGVSFDLAGAVVGPFNFALVTGSGPVDLSALVQVTPQTGTYIYVPGLPLTGGTLTGRLVIDVTGGAATLPYGAGNSSAPTGLVGVSAYPSDDVLGGIDGTARLNLYSYQRANTYSFGETIRNFLMRYDAKAMTAWYGPTGLYDGSGNPTGSTWAPWTWTGAHYEANDHGSIHAHWEVEVPDTTGALQGRLEIPFGDQTTGVIGLDKTNIKTNLADFAVRCHGTDHLGADQQQEMRLTAPAGWEKPLTFSNDSDGAAASRRWKLRATNEAEAGSNAGTNLQIVRYDDTGTLLDTPLVISRATGNVTIGPGLIARKASATVSSLSLNTSSLGGGVGVFAIGNATTAPASNPTAGGVLYVNAGALVYRGSSGTVTTIAPA